jgi:internalin A
MPANFLNKLFGQNQTASGEATAARIAQVFERPSTPTPQPRVQKTLLPLTKLFGGIEVSIAQPLLPAHGGALAAVMLVKEKQVKVALDEAGEQIIGLNLAGQGLTNAQWDAIVAALPDRGTALRALNLSANKLSVFDAAPFLNLEKLRLSDNKITAFSLPRGRAQGLVDLDLGGNPLEGVPPEVLARGRHAVLGYFKELDIADVDKIWEAKLVLVGDGGAGKTTLVRKLKNRDFKVPHEEPSTKGVETRIEYHTFKGEEGQDIKVNVWDFAGQEKYQAIHQFFYTHRALYVLLENAREQKTDFDFWFQTVELCSKGSPMIVAHNEFAEQNRGVFDLKPYQKNYPGWLKDNVRVDFKTNRGLSELEKMIRLEILRLPHIGADLPKTWVRVREALGELSKTKPYIAWEAFLDICADNGMDDPDINEAERRARDLSDYLHVLGVMLHYAEHPDLKQWVILQNEWATNVYRILDDEKIVFKEPRGHFQFADIERLWNTREYRGMHARLRDLMMEFKICYKVRDRDLFIAPALLPADPPSQYEWLEREEMRLRVEYDFMPRGLLTHFTVDQHADIADGQLLVWRTGVVLEWEGNRAEVREKYQVNNGYIEIRVQGPERKSFLQQLDRGLDHVHKSFPGLPDKVRKLVPCPCAQCSADEREPHFFDYKELREFVADKIYEDRCRKSRQMVDIRKLMDHYFSEDTPHGLGRGSRHQPQTLQPPLKVFISYSKHDREAYLVPMTKFLKPLVRGGWLQTWDDRSILPGEDWDEAIKQQLAEADIILLLVSNDSLDTEFIWNVEIKTAIERREKGEARVVPIILSPCLWDQKNVKGEYTFPPAKLNALPNKATPVASFPTPEAAWKEVADRLEEVIRALVGHESV